MAVYACECGLVLSTSNPSIRCPRCARILETHHQILVAPSCDPDTPNTKALPEFDSPDSPEVKRFSPNFGGFFAAVGYIQSRKKIGWNG